MLSYIANLSLVLILIVVLIVENLFPVGLAKQTA